MGLLQSTNLSGACPLSERQVGPAHVHGVREHGACAQRYSTAVTSAQQHMQIQKRSDEFFKEEAFVFTWAFLF